MGVCLVIHGRGAIGRARAGAALALAGLVAGCGSTSHRAAPVTRDYVGKIGPRAAAVAVVAGKANVVAYVCDWRRHVAEVFAGSRSGTRFALRGARGGKLSGVVARNQVSGTFTVKTAANTLVDLAASWATGPWTLSANLDNATDRLVLTECTAVVCTPGYGREFKLRAQYRW